MIRFRWTVTTLTLLGLCSVGVTLRAGEESGLDSVVGAGTMPVLLLSEGDPVGMPQGNLTVAALGDDESVVGTIRVRIPGIVESTAEVECLVVEGNQAVAGGRIRTGDDFPGEDLFLVVEDVPDGPDKALAVIALGFEEPPCDLIFEFAFDIGILAPPEVAHGNYKVTDAP